MGLVLPLVETEADTRGHSIDVIEISWHRGFRNVANLRLMLLEAKQLLASVQ